MKIFIFSFFLLGPSFDRCFSMEGSSSGQLSDDAYASLINGFHNSQFFQNFIRNTLSFSSFNRQSIFFKNNAETMLFRFNELIQEVTNQELSRAKFDEIIRLITQGLDLSKLDLEQVKFLRNYINKISNNNLNILLTQLGMEENLFFQQSSSYYDNQLGSFYFTPGSEITLSSNPFLENVEKKESSYSFEDNDKKKGKEKDEKEPDFSLNEDILAHEKIENAYYALISDAYFQNQNYQEVIKTTRLGYDEARNNFDSKQKVFFNNQLRKVVETALKSNSYSLDLDAFKQICACVANGANVYTSYQNRTLLDYVQMCAENPYLSQLITDLSEGQQKEAAEFSYEQNYRRNQKFVFEGEMKANPDFFSECSNYGEHQFTKVRIGDFCSAEETCRRIKNLQRYAFTDLKSYKEMIKELLNLRYYKEDLNAFYDKFACSVQDEIIFNEIIMDPKIEDYHKWNAIIEYALKGGEPYKKTEFLSAIVECGNVRTCALLLSLGASYAWLIRSEKKCPEFIKICEELFKIINSYQQEEDLEKELEGCLTKLSKMFIIPNFTNDLYWNNPLHSALKRGLKRAIPILINYGAEARLKDIYGNTAMKLTADFDLVALMSDGTNRKN